MQSLRCGAIEKCGTAEAIDDACRVRSPTAEATDDARRVKRARSPTAEATDDARRVKRARSPTANSSQRYIKRYNESKDEKEKRWTYEKKKKEEGWEWKKKQNANLGRTVSYSARVDQGWSGDRGKEKDSARARRTWGWQQSVPWCEPKRCSSTDGACRAA